MMLHYNLPEYHTTADFLSLLAKRLGRLKKGGVPDVNRAAKTVLHHWNRYCYSPIKFFSNLSIKNYIGNVAVIYREPQLGHTCKSSLTFALLAAWLFCCSILHSKLLI